VNAFARTTNRSKAGAVELSGGALLKQVKGMGTLYRAHLPAEAGTSAPFRKSRDVGGDIGPT
jgi:hypothetical protein